MKNLKYQLPAMIAVILVFAFFMRSRTIEEYVLDRYESATEIYIMIVMQKIMRSFSFSKMTGGFPVRY